MRRKKRKRSEQKCTETAKYYLPRKGMNYIMVNASNAHNKVHLLLLLSLILPIFLLIPFISSVYSRRKKN